MPGTTVSRASSSFAESLAPIVELRPSGADEEDVATSQRALLPREGGFEVFERNRFGLGVIERFPGAFVIARDVRQHAASRDATARQVIDAQARAAASGDFRFRGCRCRRPARDASRGTTHPIARTPGDKSCRGNRRGRNSIAPPKFLIVWRCAWRVNSGGLGTSMGRFSENTLPLLIESSAARTRPESAG